MAVIETEVARRCLTQFEGIAAQMRQTGERDSRSRYGLWMLSS